MHSSPVTGTLEDTKQSHHPEWYFDRYELNCLFRIRSAVILQKPGKPRRRPIPPEHLKQVLAERRRRRAAFWERFPSFEPAGKKRQDFEKTWSPKPRLYWDETAEEEAIAENARAIAEGR